MQQVRYSARLLDRLIKKLYALGITGVGIAPGGNRGKHHLGGREILSEAVMQFAGKLAAFIVAQLQQTSVQSPGSFAAGQGGPFGLVGFALRFERGGCCFAGAFFGLFARMQFRSQQSVMPHQQ